MAPVRESVELQQLVEGGRRASGSVGGRLGGRLGGRRAREPSPAPSPASTPLTDLAPTLGSPPSLSSPPAPHPPHHVHAALALHAPASGCSSPSFALSPSSADGDGHSVASTTRGCACPYLGLMLATLSSLFFSLCSVIVKWLVDVHPMELAACRFVGVLLPAVPVLLWRREQPFPKGRRAMLLLRSFVGTTGLMLSFYAFRHMPLADASVVVFSVPVFVSIFARLFLKEPCGAAHALSVALTLVGVVLITRPPLIFGHAVAALAAGPAAGELPPPLGAGAEAAGAVGGGGDGGPGGASSDLWGAAAAFAATLFGANAYVLLRALKGLHFSVVMANFGCFALAQTLLCAWAGGALCVPRCGADRLLVVALALFSFGGQILLTLALQLEQAGPVAIARSADIVFAFVWQVVFFQEAPNRYSVGGALLVVSSVLLTGLRKWALALPDTHAAKRSLSLLAR